MLPRRRSSWTIALTLASAAVLASCASGASSGVPVSTTSASVKASQGEIAKRPLPVVTVARGASAAGRPGCTDPSCAWVLVSLDGFTPNTTYKVHLDSSAGSFGAFGDAQVTTDANGAVSKQIGAFFGFPNGWVSAEVDGVTGRRDPWRA